MFWTSLLLLTQARGELTNGIPEIFDPLLRRLLSAKYSAAYTDISGSFYATHSWLFRASGRFVNGLQRVNDFTCDAGFYNEIRFVI